MIGNSYVFGAGILQPFQNPDEAKTQAVILGGGVNYPAGQVLGIVAGNGTPTNEVQTITVTGTATAGTFKLGFGDQITVPINWNDTAAQVQAKLEALSNIGTGNVAGAGGALPGTPVTITFQSRLAGIDVASLYVVSMLLTGTTPNVTIAETTKGKPAKGSWKDYSDASGGTDNVARAILKEAVETNADGSIKSLGSAFGGSGMLHASAYVSGTFRTADLTGIDANGVADLGRIISGIPGTLTDPTTLIRIG